MAVSSTVDAFRECLSSRAGSRQQDSSPSLALYNCLCDVHGIQWSCSISRLNHSPSVPRLPAEQFNNTTGRHIDNTTWSLLKSWSSGDGGGRELSKLLFDKDSSVFPLERQPDFVTSLIAMSVVVCLVVVVCLALAAIRCSFAQRRSSGRENRWTCTSSSVTVQVDTDDPPPYETVTEEEEPPSYYSLQIGVGPTSDPAPPTDLSDKATPAERKPESATESSAAATRAH